MFAFQSNQGFFNGIRSDGRVDWVESINPTSRYVYRSYQAAYAILQQYNREGHYWADWCGIVKI